VAERNITEVPGRVGLTRVHEMRSSSRLGWCPSAGSFWNGKLLEQEAFGTGSFWNRKLLEQEAFGTGSFWNRKFLESVLNVNASSSNHIADPVTEQGRVPI
jgi:hypothetical protein